MPLRAFASLLLACIVVVTGCAGTPPTTAASGQGEAVNKPSPEPAVQLHDLVEAYFEELLRLNPLFATFIGDNRYNDKLPWPTGADGDGPSIQRSAPTLYGNEPLNWFASGITPGATNVFNQPPTITITSPTNGNSFAMPANITLTANAADPDGSVLRVEYYEGDIKLGEATNAPFGWKRPSAITPLPSRNRSGVIPR